MSGVRCYRSSWRLLWAMGLVSLGVAVLLGTSTARAAGKQPFAAAGTYVEACSCSAPCPCELVGLEMGCEGVGAASLRSGSYMGVSLAGVKIAYGAAPGTWVRVYVDCAIAKQRAAATAFAKAVFSGFGKIEAVKEAKISISGQSGRYTVTVDGGKVMRFVTEPVLGGDNRTPISYGNSHNPMCPDFLQGKVVSGTYQDGERSITLEKGRNSYFNNRMRSSGRI